MTRLILFNSNRGLNLTQTQFRSWERPMHFRMMRRNSLYKSLKPNRLRAPGAGKGRLGRFSDRISADAHKTQRVVLAWRQGHQITIATSRKSIQFSLAT